jgi:RsiW-degrading membrane proteinase PrsW (M82 family)
VIDNNLERNYVARTSPDWLHYLNLIRNGLLFLSSAALSVAVLVFLPKKELRAALGGSSDRAIYIWAYILIFFALLALITFIDSAKKVSRKSKPARDNSSCWLYFVILLFPLLLFAIKKWEYSNAISDWLFSLLVFLAIALPIVWMLRVASGKLWNKHGGRDAAMFTWSFGMSTPFIMIVQALLVTFLIFTVVLANVDLSFLTDMNNIDSLVREPSIIFVLFLILSVVAPVTEELFKTLAIWPLMGLRISSSEGFVAGLMSGAAFALFEGAMYASQAVMLPDNEWVFFILGRIGGSLLHTFNGGLIGWALAKTWQDKKVYRALIAYLIAIAVHALWNFNVFWTQLLPAVQGNEPNNMFSIGLMIGLGLIIVIGFALLMVYISKEEKQEQSVVYGR